MTNSWLDQLKEDILNELSHRPLTIRDLMDLLKTPYSTTQQAVKQLTDEELITRFDRKTRGARYTINPKSNGPLNVIPMINFDGNIMKMTLMMNAQAAESFALKNTQRIFKAWSVVANTARRMDEGIPPNAMMRKLTVQKAELSKAIANFEQLAFLARQILENPKFWDIDTLAQYPMDPDWNEEFLRLLASLTTYLEQTDDEQQRGT